MTTESNKDKLEQFNEFFAISYEFNVNVSPLERQSVSYQQFINNMPMPFKMAGDIVTLDQSALRPLQTLGGVANQLVDYLNHQSQKIDLLVGYILSQLDESKQRVQGTSFGGGGITFISKQELELAALVELKIFLQSENCAVYCYGEIIERTEEAEHFSHKAIFHYIREEDREILVRTSLHQQSKQLKQLAKQRNEESKNS